MKKTFLFLATLITVFLLVSCNSTPSNDNKPLESNDKSSLESETREFVVGDTTYHIPKKPQRIVADYYVGELLYLGAPLVGADLTWPSNAWIDQTKDLTDVGQSMEMVSSLSPDLIITMNEDFYAQYKSIAPTILIPWGTYNPEELMLALGEITGTQEKATAWQSDFESRIGELKKVMPDATANTISIIDVFGTDLYLYGEHFSRAGYILYNKLGFKGPEEAEKTFIRDGNSWLMMTPEMMPNYIGDYLLFLNEEGAPGSNPDVTSRYTDNVIWENLPAVKNDHVFYFKSADFMHEDPYSLDLQIDALMEIFSHAS